jgi:hypothetical protein
MALLNRREFTERFGDPASFVYSGQYYLSTTPTKCALCGRAIRNVYTLRSPKGRSLPSGECCFSYFMKWNNTVYTRLLAGQILLDSYSDTIEQDAKNYSTVGDLKQRQDQWRKMRSTARARIRTHQKATGSDWLPKNLYDLQAEIALRPGKTTRWFDLHIPILRDLLAIKNPSL